MVGIGVVWDQKLEAVWAANARRSMNDHPRLCKLLETFLITIKQLPGLMSQAGPGQYLSNRNLQVVHLLFTRSLELATNSYWCALTGSYGTAKCLSRLLIENSELARLSSKRPSVAPDWIGGKEFRAEKVRKALHTGADLKSVTALYGGLSDYIHPNPTGWYEYIKTTPQTQTTNLAYLPVEPFYEVQAAKESLRIIAYGAWLTLLSVREAFDPWLQPLSGELDRIANEIASILSQP